MAGVLVGAVLVVSPEARAGAAEQLKRGGAELVAMVSDATSPAHPSRTARATAGRAGRYANGRIPASALCPIGQGSHRLRCDAAGAWRKLSAAYAHRFGTRLLVTDSYRSYAAQVSCRARKGALCAVPGTSNHGLGVAVDLAAPGASCSTAAHRWLESNAGRYGWLWPAWARPGASTHGAGGECWHWQYRTST